MRLWSLWTMSAPILPWRMNCCRRSTSRSSRSRQIRLYQTTRCSHVVFSLSAAFGSFRGRVFPGSAQDGAVFGAVTSAAKKSIRHSLQLGSAIAAQHALEQPDAPPVSSNGCPIMFKAFKEAFDEHVTPKRCAEAFRRCGVYPFNPLVIIDSLYFQEGETKESLSVICGGCGGSVVCSSLPQRGVHDTLPVRRARAAVMRIWMMTKRLPRLPMRLCRR